MLPADCTAASVFRDTRMTVAVRRIGRHDDARRDVDTPKARG
jgi:hypothetical protein